MTPVLRLGALLLALGAFLPPVSANAQPASVCQVCIAAAGCDAARDNCVASCRAQYFTIDPNRSDCIARCSTDQARCTRTAEAGCHTQQMCR